MAVAAIGHRRVDWAVVSDAVECVLQDSEVGPSVDEVAMEAQPCRVTVGKYEVGVREVGSCEEELVEERIERHRVRFGAIAALVASILIVRVRHLAMLLLC